MKYKEGITQLDDYRKKISDIRKQMRVVQAEIEPEQVPDYEFKTETGTARLSDLFGDKDYLFIIHNMGASCSYCTLWADGYNGIYEHLKQRAAFYVSSPDSPEHQAKFAKARNWNFPMISHAETDFAADMGYWSEAGFHPGISVFVLRDGSVYRISDTELGPWDDFNTLWHMFDLAPGIQGDWHPMNSYG